MPEPTLDVDITFSEDAVEDKEEYWEDNDDNPFGGDYIGPEIPTDIKKVGVSLLEVSNILAGIGDDAEFIDSLLIENS